MKLRTHFLIAKIASENSGFTFWERNVFCVGSLIPDFSPMQFIHRHFYAKSGEYVEKKLKQISGRNSLLVLMVYGKMAHYVSDFCCSVHSGGGIGNIHEHIQYERALNYYALENYELMKYQCMEQIKQQSLKNILNQYNNSIKSDFHTDLTFAIKACIEVCEMTKSTSYAQNSYAGIQSSIIDETVYYGCSDHGI